MRDKILKTELLIFFVFTLTGLVYFHFGHSLPDNMFAISSEVEKTGVITYFFTGILAFLGLISGPWMLGPFFIFIFLYSFLLSKRTFVFDLFMAPFLGLFFLSISQL